MIRESYGSYEHPIRVSTLMKCGFAYTSAYALKPPLPSGGSPFTSASPRR